MNYGEPTDEGPGAPSHSGAGTGERVKAEEEMPVGESMNDIIVAALAAGRTYREAGEAAGVSERTVRRRMQQPHFVAQVEHERAAQVKRVADGLGGLALAAVETLQALLSPASPPAVRCRAAQAILSSSRTWGDAADSEGRLVQLEKSVAAMMATSLP